MSQNFGKNPANETDIDQLVRVTKELEKAFQTMNGTLDKLTKSQWLKLIKITTDYMKVEKQILEQKRKEAQQFIRDNVLHTQRKRLQDDEHNARRFNTAQLLNDRKQARLWNTQERIEKAKARADNLRGKIVLEQLHDSHVRQHIMMRNALRGSTDKLNFFTRSLTKGLAVGTAMGAIGSGLTGLYKNRQLIKSKQEELNKFTAQHGQNPTDPQLLQEVKNMEAQLKDLIEKTDKSLTARALGTKGESALEKMGEFATKHAGGLLIGAGSAGVLIMIVKKALSASPVFQQISQLLDYGINMLLRPIGDFFGFLLRPIVIMLMRMFIIPFYRTMYPFFRDWGTKIGEALVWLVGDNGWLAIIAMGVLALVAAFVGLKIGKKMIGGMIKGFGASEDVLKGVKMGGAPADIAGAAGKAGEGTKGTGILDDLKKLVGDITDGTKLEEIKKLLSAKWSGFLESVTTGFSKVGTVFKDLKDGFGETLDAFKLKDVGTLITNKFNTVLKEIKVNFVKIKGTFGGVIGDFKKWFDAFDIKTVTNIASEKFSKVLETINTKFAEITTKFGKIVDSMSEAFKGLKLGEIADNFISAWKSFTNAISDGIGKLTGKISEAEKTVTGVKDAVKVEKAVDNALSLGKFWEGAVKFTDGLSKFPVFKQIQSFQNKWASMEAKVLGFFEKNLAKIVGKTAAKTAVKSIPIIGWALAGLDAAGSATQALAPEQYQQLRNLLLDKVKEAGGDIGATETVLDFLGWGKESTLKQVQGAVDMIRGIGDGSITSADNVEPHWAGGMITEPILGIGRSGKKYSFGERGAESITPVGSGSMSSAPITVNINISNMSGDVNDINRLRSVILSVMQEVNTKRGRV